MAGVLIRLGMWALFSLALGAKASGGSETDMVIALAAISVTYFLMWISNEIGDRK